MVLDAVLFDLDGTLIEFKIDYQQIKKELIEVLKPTGYPLSLMLRERYVLKLLSAVNQFLLDKNIWTSEQIHQINLKSESIIAEKEKKAAEKAQVISGIREVLEFLQIGGIKMGIITLNTSTNSYISLESAGLDQFFPNKNWIVGRDQVSKLKPDPIHPNELIKRMGVDPRKTCLIGDHPTDIQAAIAINCRSIALRNSNYITADYETPYIIHRSEINPKMIDLLREFNESE